MYFLDTNICIDFLRGKLQTGYAFLQENPPQLFKIPAVVEAELLVGAEKSANPEKSRRAVEIFLLPFEIVPFDSQCAKHYAQTRAKLELSGKKIGPNDLLIGATVLSHAGTLITNNVKEFKRVEGLHVESWAEVSV